MIDSPQQRQKAQLLALVSSAAYVLLMSLVGQDAQGILDLDRTLGQDPYEFTRDHEWARHLFLGIGHATAFWPMFGLTVVVAVALFAKNHRRAAIWVVIVMTSTSLITTLCKVVIDRDRPFLDDPIDVLTSSSFPSGHSSSIAAAAGIAIVLARMLVRRRGLRRLTYVLALSVELLIGIDRIFLGVHNFSDVVGGYLLGAATVLLALLLFDPQPRSTALKADPLPETVPPSRRKVAAILNPIKVDDPAGFRAMVERMATESGWAEVAWWHTTAEDTGYSMAHEAAVSGADLVIAIGGDGTIRAVCEELAGTGIPVGIIPAGTGNLLARNLSIPLYLRAAVDVGLNGQDRAIDMVRVSGDEMEDATFLVMAGMGFDAAIMEGVNEDFKKKVGWLAYAWSGLKALMFPAIKVEISIDGGEFTKHRARTIVIGNVGSLQAGMPLIPDAEIDDGQLDVVLLYPRRFLSWLPLAARILTKNKRTDASLTRMTGHTVVVRASAAAPRQLDGDLIEPGRELRAECDHGRLLVRVPR
ncbi:YegS/Rv2252/BmrU family lipid kinase [Marmoricola sp. OAE513]|uniref:diacylglycerol kinase family protein n=1 Tax=Marmoricola sp. OAE513 TaxID=2817894 RepID=UPI001DD356FA